MNKLSIALLFVVSTVFGQYIPTTPWSRELLRKNTAAEGRTQLEISPYYQPADSDLTNWASISTNILGTFQPADEQLTNWAQIETNVLASFQPTNYNLTASWSMVDTNWVLQEISAIGVHVYSSGTTNSTALAGRTNVWQGWATPVTGGKYTNTVSVSAGVYARHVVSTNTLTRLGDGPISIRLYAYKSVAGTVSMYPEFYLYDTVADTLAELGAAPAQTISATTPTLYQWSISVAGTNVTNPNKMVVAWKIATAVGSPSVSFVSGQEYDSHFSFAQNLASATILGSQVQGSVSSATNATSATGATYATNTSAGLSIASTDLVTATQATNVSVFDWTKSWFRDDFIVGPNQNASGTFLPSGLYVYGTGAGRLFSQVSASAGHYPRFGVFFLLANTINSGIKVCAFRNSGTGYSLANFATMTNWEMRVLAKLQQTATTVASLGFLVDPGNTTPATNYTTDGFYFYYNVSNANWFVRSYSASALYETNTGVAADTSWHTFKLTSTISNQIQCSIDSGNPILVTNTSTSHMGPTMEVFAAGAANMYLQLDILELYLWGLTR